MQTHISTEGLDEVGTCYETSSGLGNRPPKFATFRSVQEHVIRIIICFQRLIFNSQTNCLGQRKFVYEGTLFKVNACMVTFTIFLASFAAFFSHKQVDGRKCVQFQLNENGFFLQHKSGKELQAFLCNDFLLLTRENSSLAKKIGKDSEKQYVMYQPVGITIVIMIIIIITTNNTYCLSQPIRLNEITVKVPDQNSMLILSHFLFVHIIRRQFCLFPSLYNLVVIMHLSLVFLVFPQ